MNTDPQDSLDILPPVFPLSKKRSIVDTLSGVIERITFYNDETGYLVAKLRTEDDKDGLVTIVGKIASPNAGEHLEVQGYWTENKRYGRQLKILDYRLTHPKTARGIEKFLASKLINGIGPVYAQRIVERFGEMTLDVIDHTPEHLLEVEGIGKKKLEKILQGWNRHKKIREVMIFLLDHNVSPTFAVRIYSNKNYGDRAIEVVKENPYQLIRDVKGIGFLSADRIAASIGIKPNSPERLAAGILHVLYQFAEQGNMYAPQEELIKEASGVLDIEEEEIERTLAVLAGENEIIIEQDRVYNATHMRLEQEAASRLIAIRDNPTRHSIPADTESFISPIEESFEVCFSDSQRDAVKSMLESKILI
ncbi:MAG TPA: ATP-dependent RecD-like DNA helicase, partial [bacterium]|nr:ATP-dependent RecD-like DNA helicase [bacterium]